MKTGLTEVKASQAEMKTSQDEMKTGLTDEIKSVHDEMTKDIKSVQDQLTREMKEELQGISAAQDAMKEVVQERLSTMETKMDFF